MGKIKSKQIKRSARILIEKNVDFTGDFEGNKKILKDVMPSKKMRNQLAGYLTRIKKYKKRAPKIVQEI